MEALQNLLTATIEFVAIAGFGGIVAHALYTWHLSQLPTAPKANPDYQRSELVEEILQTMPTENQPTEVHEYCDYATVNSILNTLREEAAQAQVSAEVDALEDDGLRGEYGFEVISETKEIAQPQQIDLNNLDAVTLRKLCTQHQIAWRNFKGANRHMPKATMIFNLQQRLTA